MTESKYTPLRTALSYRWLKVLVIILGIVLVLGFVVLVVGIVTKPSGVEAGKPYSMDINVPRGASIIDAKLQEQRLILRVKTVDGEDVVILDSKTGREVGRVRVKPKP